MAQHPAQVSVPWRPLESYEIDTVRNETFPGHTHIIADWQDKTAAKSLQVQLDSGSSFL